MSEASRLKLIICLILAALLLMICSHIQKKSEMTLYPQKYSEYVEKYSDEYGIDEHIIYSVIKVESDFDKNAVSSSGAIGLMQLMPETYIWLCEKNGEEPKNAFDAEENIKYGTFYLSMLYKRYGDWNFKIEFEETERYVYKLKVSQDKYLKLY